MIEGGSEEAMGKAERWGEVGGSRLSICRGRESVTEVLDLRKSVCKVEGGKGDP